jgi:exonuclease VII large subunit
MILNNNTNNQQAEKNKSDDSSCSNQPSRKHLLLPDITISTNNNKNILNTSNNLVIHPNKKHKINHKRSYIPENNKHMSKEELKQWRMHQRKLRNRQSAAASRQKVRNRVETLERELQALQHKYNAALDRLKTYEPSFSENDLYNDGRVPNNAISVSPPSPLPSVVSSTSSVDTNANTTNVSPSMALRNTNIEPQHQPVENNNMEPQLVEEQLQEVNNVNTTDNLFDITTNSDDQELEEFLSYAFGENE